MIDQPLAKSNFIGRDGFRWWIGQIPPESAQSEQMDGCGWGNRMKVRIMGYHPADETELSNDDLPWAQVLLPTTAGTGAANYATNPKLRPGDVVVGFFLDGDNAQIPMIMGAMGRTALIPNSNKDYRSPFVPFTGYTGNIEKPNGRLWPDQSNESKDGSQISPRQAPPDVVDKINNGKSVKNEITAFSGLGKEIVFADTCEDTSTKTIKSEINNLLKLIQDGKNKISEYQQKIKAAADIITTSLSWIVGQMMNYLYNFLVGTEKKPGIIPNGLKLLYTSVYGSVFAATGNPAAAHQAGVKSNEAFVIPVKVLEQALSCVAASILNGLRSLVENLLKSLLDNVKHFVTCAAEQFLGSLLNSVVDSIASGLSGALDGIAGILTSGFNVIDTLRSSVDAIKGLGGVFDCNQDTKKYSESGAKEWIIGQGPKSTMDVNSAFNNIFNSMNTIGSQIQGIAGSGSGVVGSISNTANIFTSDNLNNAFQNAVNSASGCFTGFPTNCGPPSINIFGGGGAGASALPVFGTISTLANSFNNVTQTAGIIGAIVTNGGSGYTFPPFVEFADSCGLGYGAIGRATIKDGQVVSIYMVSTGEGYPIGDTAEYGVSDVLVQEPGFGYTSDDTAIDNLGNSYKLNIQNGSIIGAVPLLNNIKVIGNPVIRINSETGTGAILKPLFGPIKDVGDPIKQIDCVR